MIINIAIIIFISLVVTYLAQILTEIYIKFCNSKVEVDDTISPTYVRMCDNTTTNSNLNYSGENIYLLNLKKDKLDLGGDNIKPMTSNDLNLMNKNKEELISDLIMLRKHVIDLREKIKILNSK